MASHPAVQARLERLAPDQRAAATAPSGPVLCVAPAGSGKTTTLVARIAWAIDGGRDPATVTAITFNRRAALELRARVDDALTPLALPPGTVRIATFHALGRAVLREAGVDVRQLVDRMSVLRALPGQEEWTPTALGELDLQFSRWKLDLGLDPLSDPVEPQTTGSGSRITASDLAESRGWTIYRAYQARLRETGSLDFDDLVARARRELATNPPLLHRWRTRSAMLLVDEVQDLDRSQLQLALLLAGPAADIFLVGDDDQTIYAWRLADVRRVLGLAAELPGLRRVDLTTNYRCPAPVVARSVRLIEHNVERFDKRIVARSSAEGRLMLNPDPSDEVTRARRLIHDWIRDGPAQYAVLARTNAELAPIAAAALEATVPYHAEQDGLILDAAQLTRLLETLQQHADSAASDRGALLLAIARARDAVVHLADESPATRVEAALVAQSLLVWAAAFDSVSDLIEAIRQARQRRHQLRQDDAHLVLATIHGTKGLEFDHVACIGLDEGVFPSGHGLTEAADPVRYLEEERRLAYVAWTRARSSLLLVYDPAAPSIFVREAFDPQELSP